MALMWASLFLFLGTLFAVVRFLKNSSDGPEGLEWPADEDLEDIHPDRGHSTEGFIVVGLLAFTIAIAVSYVGFAHDPGRDRPLPPDGVLWTPEALLRDFFQSSEQVHYKRMSLTREEQAQLATLTRTERANARQLLYVARTGARIDGYAFLSAADQGRDPAAFGVQVSAEGRVKRVEVMRLLDTDQQEVLDRRFLHQFEGHALPDAPHLHRRIESPIGCTSACRDATRDVRQALFLVSKTRSPGTEVASSSAPAWR